MKGPHTMTVAELITELRKCNQTDSVMLIDSDGAAGFLERVEEDTGARTVDLIMR